jgi:uncharacterized protein (TIGR02246 family)
VNKFFSLVVGGAALFLAAGSLTGQQPNKPEGGGDVRAADQAAIKEAGKAFLKAFKAGDAKAMGAFWTEDGEYHSDDGTVLHGRAAIEKAYSEAFAKKKPKFDADIEVTSIRFPSKDTAIEEGYFKVKTGKESPLASRYTILHVREGGKWLMAVVREWPAEGITLRDLDWLIGTWKAKRDANEVTATYEWWGDKTYLKATITVKQEGKESTGFQMICVDKASGQIHSWTFDPDGSFAEATWSRDGKKWMLDSAAVLEDGSVVAGTNIMTWIDNDTFTFQSVGRTVNGEEADDIPPVRVSRVKGK